MHQNRLPQPPNPDAQTKICAGFVPANPSNFSRIHPTWIKLRLVNEAVSSKPRACLQNQNGIAGAGFGGWEDATRADSRRALQPRSNAARRQKRPRPQGCRFSVSVPFAAQKSASRLFPSPQHCRFHFEDTPYKEFNARPLTPSPAPQHSQRRRALQSCSPVPLGARPAPN
jgi:hypothetical protein